MNQNLKRGIVILNSKLNHRKKKSYYKDKWSPPLEFLKIKDMSYTNGDNLWHLQKLFSRELKYETVKWKQKQQNRAGCPDLK